MYYPRLPDSRIAEVKAHAEAVEKDRLDQNKNVVTVDDLPSTDGTVVGPTKRIQMAEDDAVSAAQSEYSLGGRFGHAIEPVINALSPWRWQISLAISAVTLSSGEWPINRNVCHTRASGNRFRKGDCPS